MRRLLALLLLVSLARAQEEPPPAPPAPPPTAQDLQRLEAAFAAQGLLDPRGARRVRVTVLDQAPDQRAAREGWVLPGEGRPDWVLLDDLSLAPVAPDTPVEDGDFPGYVRERLVVLRAAAEAAGGPGRRVVFNDEERGSAGQLFVWAAWARRLGHDDLVAELVAFGHDRGRSEWDRRQAPLDGRVARLVRTGLMATAVRAFGLRHDVEAQAALAALELRGAAEGDAPTLRALARDLERRALEGRLGQAHALPEDIDELPMDARVPLLVRSLEDVTARRLYRWADDVGADPRVQALIASGPPAVSALLDCAEKDERLTRSSRASYGTDQAPQPHTVRDAAWAALQAILELREFDPTRDDDDYEWSAESSKPVPVRARLLRAHWEATKGLSFEGRLRHAVLDPRAPARVRREASWVLAGRPRSAMRRLQLRGQGGRDRAAALALSDPTAAEAILSAFDREQPGAADPFRVDAVYMAALAALGDRRIGPALRARFDAPARPSLRVELAMACQELGVPEPLEALAAAVTSGSALDVPAERRDPFDTPSAPSRLLDALAAARSPACDAALAAVCEPSHPLFRVALDDLLEPSHLWFVTDDAWRAHPACLRVLRAALADDRPSGRTYTLDGRNLSCSQARHTFSGPAPDWLDVDACERTVTSRVSDEAAACLGELVPMIPRHHPLYRDRDARLAALRAAAAGVLERARRPTPLEAAALGLGGRARFIPDVVTLEGAATAEDVAAGRALFHLEHSVRADVRLPAAAEVVRDGGARERALVVQAETGPDGERVFGVITARGAFTVGPAALSGFCPLPGPEAHRAAVTAFVDVLLRGDLDALAGYFDGNRPRAFLERFLDYTRKRHGTDRAALEDWAAHTLVPLPGGQWRAGY